MRMGAGGGGTALNPAPRDMSGAAPVQDSGHCVVNARRPPSPGAGAFRLASQSCSCRYYFFLAGFFAAVFLAGLAAGFLVAAM